MFDSIRRKLIPPDEYALLRTHPGRELLERLDEPITALEAEARFGLQDGKFALQEIRAGQFGKAVWTEEFGDPRDAREMRELRREVQALKSDSRAPDFDDELKQATFKAVLEGQLDVAEAEAIAGLSAAFEGGGGRRGLAESVENPKDVGEIAGRAVLDLMDDPRKLERVSKASGSAASAFLDGALDGLEDDDGAAAIEESGENLSGREADSAPVAPADVDVDEEPPARGRTPSAEEHLKELRRLEAEGDVDDGVDDAEEVAADAV